VFAAGPGWFLLILARSAALRDPGPVGVEAVRRPFGREAAAAAGLPTRAVSA
jgi:hypothetical protein